MLRWICGEVNKLRYNGNGKVLKCLMALEIITTSDGSHSLLNTALNETYHSVHGAVQESIHIFINNGLEYHLNLHVVQNIKILEVGFGTALNVLLTIGYAQQSLRQIELISLESSPIGLELASQLNYPDLLKMKDANIHFSRLHACPWNERLQVLPNLVIEKQHIELENAVLTDSTFDIIYYDAFAPGKQPELWEIPAFRKIISCMKPGGVFVTYCAKGQVKRDLKSLGLIVETLPGPPGKKEMVRATKGLENYTPLYG
jgi:tRNA U34 5-methylaminomethyl-2-thiouridine-forming methyltransferase MnmC